MLALMTVMVEFIYIYIIFIIYIKQFLTYVEVDMAWF